MCSNTAMLPLKCDSITSVTQIKDEQGNFKNENFSELRHVAFGIKDQDGNVDGEKPAPARSASLSWSCELATKADRNDHMHAQMVPVRSLNWCL